MTADPGARELDDDVAGTLLASRALLGVVAQSIGEALEQVSLAQFRVLVLLVASGPLRAGVVAERMGIHPSTFTRNADRLVAAGWVRRTVDPSSRQSVLIEPTPAARDLVAEVTARREARLREILAAMPPAERRAVGAALASFARAAGEPGPDALSPLGM